LKCKKVILLIAFSNLFIGGIAENISLIFIFLENAPRLQIIQYNTKKRIRFSGCASLYLERGNNTKNENLNLTIA